MRMKEKYLKNRRRGRGPDDLFTINRVFLRLTTLQKISDFYNNSFWVKIIFFREKKTQGGGRGRSLEFVFTPNLIFFVTYNSAATPTGSVRTPLGPIMQ